MAQHLLRRTLKTISRPALIKLLVTVAVLLALYAALGFLAVPAAIRHYLPRLVAEQLHRTASLGDVRFNPFLFKLDARDFVLSEKDGAPIVGFRRLFVDLELSGVIHWAWTLADITVDGLNLHLDVRPDGRLNLAALADSFPKSEKKSAGLPRFVLQHVAISSGVLVFSDHSGPTVSKVTIRPIHINLHQISSLPERRGPITVVARLPGGGSFRWRGEVSLEPARSSGMLSVKKLQAGTVWKLLQDEVKVAEPAGDIDFETKYRFSYSGAAPRLVLEDMHLGMKGLALSRQGANRPLLGLKSVEVSGAHFDLEKREFVVPVVKVMNGAVAVAKDKANRLDWQMLTKTRVKVGKVDHPEETGSRPWNVKLNKVGIENLKLSYLDNSRENPFSVVAQSFGAGFSAALEFGGGSTQVSVNGVKASVSNISLAEVNSEKPLLALDDIALDGARLDLRERQVHLGTINVQGGLVEADADQTGRINWERLMAPGPDVVERTQVETESGKPWRVQLDRAEIAGVKLNYADHSLPIPVALSAQAVGAGFSATLETGGPEMQASVTDATASVSQFQASEIKSDDPLLTLDAIALEGGHLDLRSRQIGAARISLRGGKSKIVRDRNGRIRISDVLGAGGKQNPREKSASPAHTETVGSHPWQFALGALDLEGFELALSDRTTAPAVAYDLRDVRIGVKNLRNDGKTPIKFDASLRIAEGGRLRASGDIGQGLDRASAKFRLMDLNLKPLGPLVSSLSTLALKSGQLSSDMQVAYSPGKDSPRIKMKGTTTVADLQLNESATGERLLAWKGLSAKGIQFSSAPRRLEIKEVNLSEPAAKIVVFKDRSTNLSGVIKSPEDGTSQSPKQTARKPEEQAQATGKNEKSPTFPFAVERVVVSKGDVDFADHSLVLPFAADVQDVEGEISGISTDAGSRALVKLQGRVEKYGLARVDGSLAPADPKAFTDLHVNFRNVEMPPLSPYSATFAGRKIASGKLTLDLQYKIVKGELVGNNKAVMDKFTLGEHVKSPDALDLPLDLAIALLSDSNGRIDVEIPVKGDLDKPEFSYGHLISRAIGKLVTGIVAAPFKALASLFGGIAGKHPDTISFDPGSGILLPPEMEKLKAIATVLGKRPRLRLAVQGQYGDSDREAFRRQAVRVAVAQKLGRKTSPKEALGAVNVTDAKTQQALEAVFVARHSEQALSQLAAAVGKARGKPVQRISGVLALVGRASSDTAFYQELLKRLIETTTVPDEKLIQLAQARAQSVISQLVDVGGVQATRLERRKPLAAGTGQEAAQVKLTLDTGTQTAQN